MPRWIAVLVAGLLLFADAGAAAEQGKPDSGEESEEMEFRRNLAEGAAFLEKGPESAPRALGRFRVALKMRPDSAEAYYWIGLTYSDLGNFDMAAKNAEKATLCDRKLAKAWLLWGQSLMYLARWEEAKAQLDQAHHLADDDPLVSFNLARCYYHGFGNMNDALYLFRETVKRLEDSHRSGRRARIYAQAKLYIGSCCLAKDMVLAAIGAFRDVVEMEPDNLDARYRLGVAYRLNDRVAEAETTLFSVVKQNPRHCEATLQLGHLYVVDRPNRRLAEHYLKAFLVLAPAEHPWRERVEQYLQSLEKPPPEEADADKTPKGRAAQAPARKTGDAFLPQRP